MRRRIIYILTLIIISVSGLLSIQYFWIYNSYKVNQLQFTKEINEVIKSCVNSEMNLRYSQMLEFLFTDKKTTILREQPDTVNGVSIDSLLKSMTDTEEETEHFDMNINIQPFHANSLEEVPDNIGLDIKSMLKTALVNELKGKIELNLNALDSLVKNELDKRNITSSYFIEVLNNSKDSVINRNIEIDTKKKNVLYSTDVPANILKSFYVRLGFPNQRKAILSQMKGILGVSFALIIIIVVCFIYMLRTILKQKKLSDIKNDFINNMTHELKTPIATVSAAVESMQNFNVLDDKIKTEKYLDISSNELKRLSGLVEKVLNISAYERKTLRLNPEKIDFKELIQNIITSQSVKNTGKKVDISYEPDIENAFVLADRAHFTNVVNNLIDNAIKYSGEEVKIKIVFEYKNQQKIIRFIDNGLGISKQDQSKIFDKFYRVPTGNIHKVKGFGLGLHYVKNIIEEHGGTVNVKSTPGKGSEFIIRLP